MVKKKSTQSKKNRVSKNKSPSPQQSKKAKIKTPRREKALCFAIVPFSHKMVDVYKLGIKSTVEELGFKCRRADELEHNGKITDKIISSIKQAHFIVADLTGANPNCYYELGFAHAMDKTSILVIDASQEMPFDVKDFNFIRYENITQLRQLLKKRIMGSISGEVDFNLYMRDQIEPSSQFVVPCLQLGFQSTNWGVFSTIKKLAKENPKRIKGRANTIKELEQQIQSHRTLLNGAMISLRLPDYLTHEVDRIVNEFLYDENLEKIKLQIGLYISKEFGPLCFGAFVVAWELGYWPFKLPLYEDSKIARAAAERINDILRELEEKGQVIVPKEVHIEITNLLVCISACKEGASEFEQVWRAGTLRILDKYMKLYGEDEESEDAV